MDNRTAPRTVPPTRPTHLTPWQEYERAAVVSRQWRKAWEKTHEHRYRVLAEACQQMAQEWLEVAHRLRDISADIFQHETNKLAPESVPELELA
jgi:hypothetical protein